MIILKCNVESGDVRWQTTSRHRLTPSGEQERDVQHSDIASDDDDGHGQCGQRACRLAPPPPPRLAAFNTLPPAKQVLPAHTDAARHTLKTFSANAADCGYLHKYFQPSRSSTLDAVISTSASPSPQCCPASSPQQNGPSVVWTSNCNGLLV